MEFDKFMADLACGQVAILVHSISFRRDIMVVSWGFENAAAER